MKVARALVPIAAGHIPRELEIAVHHGLPLVTRDGRVGDLDHTLVPAGDPPDFIIAIETKAETPESAHLKQIADNAERASRRYFRRAPQYRIVVHPNSNEPVESTPPRARLGSDCRPYGTTSTSCSSACTPTASGHELASGAVAP